MIPYLNGLHLTIDSWRPNRDDQGWKIGGQPTHSVTQYPLRPTTVKAVPRLHQDVSALKTLCATPTPPWRRVRPKKTAAVYYGFGDASGSAYGAALQQLRSGKGDDPPRQVLYEYGQWLERATEEESSNWREFTNLVEFLESQSKGGGLNDSELFMFTDNSTADAAFWKGTSKSPKLLELVLRLRKLEMSLGITIHLVHISGKRMIASGIDGLSRGDHSTGIMAGQSLLSFVPLASNALERSPQLKRWLQEVVNTINPKWLNPDDWFRPHQGSTTWLWSPPPAAADAAVERLRISRHLRPNSLHIVVVPRLMTGRWRKNLGKASDCYFTLHSETLWPLDVQFEPLLIFICLPYLPHRPLLRERADLCARLCGNMLKSDLPEGDHVRKRDFLRQLLIQARSLSCL